MPVLWRDIPVSGGNACFVAGYSCFGRECLFCGGIFLFRAGMPVLWRDIPVSGWECPFVAGIFLFGGGDARFLAGYSRH
jgi:hypothetical protein